MESRIAALRSSALSSNMASAFSSETKPTRVPRASSWLVLSYTSWTTASAPKPVPERPSSRQNGVS